MSGRAVIGVLSQKVLYIYVSVVAKSDHKCYEQMPVVAKSVHKVMKSVMKRYWLLPKVIKKCLLRAKSDKKVTSHSFTICV